jgi:hypothetical protein
VLSSVAEGESMMKQMILAMSSVVFLGIGATGCAADDGVQTSETSSNATMCWPVAGLYNTPCDTSQSNIREDIRSGEQVDILPNAANCNGEAWYNVVHHVTGHHGWVRGPSLCGL